MPMPWPQPRPLILTIFGAADADGAEASTISAATMAATDEYRMGLELDRIELWSPKSRKSVICTQFCGLAEATPRPSNFHNSDTKRFTCQPAIRR
jgi:hypothetical protein